MNALKIIDLKESHKIDWLDVVVYKGFFYLFFYFYCINIFKKCWYFKRLEGLPFDSGPTSCDVHTHAETYAVAIQSW